MARFCLQLNAGIGRNLAMAFAADTGERKNSRKIERVELPEKVRNSRVLILGGTGRVGGSTALALSKFCPDLRIIVGGRNRDKGAAMVTKLGNSAEFSEVDINDSKSLQETLKDVDLVIHTAGPFQQAEKCTVLEAAIRNQETLRDRSKVQQLVQLFDPLVRAVDGIIGEKVSMRVDLDCSDGKTRIGIFSHKRLSESVGISTAAFALAILEGSTQPGVWFPEEPEGIAIEARETLLSRAAQGTINFIMNK
ncbi:UNVERIFIED_CONTAM: hypothetical protein Sradi_1367800 [Sesamum radiatum]|uniref:Saccharopine dehydrogenase NADP binding domain-containing protein n=1 Tax=Sesamum radiatum TaxID=300843 RepID=A0AAW2URJ9_SESRA